LSTVRNNNLLAGLTTLRSEGLNLLDNIHALNDLAENYVLAVQPAGLGCADKELGTVGVGASVSHGQNSWTSVCQLEVLILKFVAVDGLATGAVVGCEITTLAHEVGDDSVEGGGLEAESLLAGAQGTEILSCLRDNIGPELHDNPADRGAVSGHVKVHTGRHFIFRRSHGCGWIPSKG